MNEMNGKETSKNLWTSIVSIVMLIAGGACFILSCVAAMIITNKNN